jgi:hypothetical protein
LEILFAAHSVNSEFSASAGSEISVLVLELIFNVHTYLMKVEYKLVF